MKTYKLIAIAAFALLANACQDQSNEILEKDSNVIVLDAKLPATRATLSQFENGDKFSLWAVEYNGDEVAPLQISGNYINNELITYDGAGWDPQRTLYWSQNPCDFYAVYPAIEPNSVEEFPFTIRTDQDSAETAETLSGYEASDLMWAKSTKVAKSDGTVKLAFNHMMSRLIVNIVRGPEFEGELPEDVTVHVYNTATTAMVSLKNGTLEKDPSYGSKTISMRKLSNDTFDAIIVPQNIERKTPLIEITMEGIAYLLDYSMSFQPGYQYTVSVTLNTSPDQEKIEISIDGDVGDWQ
ncbi:MAG: fimbrillin family protein [Rikenellaceae bacterium]|nr:fimbrillin family protein [Rikenellaceae bacterium]